MKSLGRGKYKNNVLGKWKKKRLEIIQCHWKKKEKKRVEIKKIKRLRCKSEKNIKSQLEEIERNIKWVLTYTTLVIIRTHCSRSYTHTRTHTHKHTISLSLFAVYDTIFTMGIFFLSLLAKSKTKKIPKQILKRRRDKKIWSKICLQFCRCWCCC